MAGLTVPLVILLGMRIFPRMSMSFETGSPTATWAFRRFAATSTELYPLTGPVHVAGSASDNDWLLPAEAPAYALQLTWRAQGWQAESLVPGWTFECNGQRVAQVSLRSGDRLCLAGETWVLEPSSVESKSAPSDRDAVAPPAAGQSDRILSALRDFHVSIGAETDLRVLLTGLLKALVELLQASDGFVFNLNATGQPDVLVGTRDRDSGKLFSDTVVQAALKSREPLLLSSGLDNPLFSASESISSLRLRSVICCPIQVAGRLLGLFYVGSNSSARTFTTRDRDTLSLFATFAGSLVHHAAFIDQQSRLLRAVHEDASEVGLLGNSEALHAAIQDAVLLAPSPLNLLIQGETGSGKELFAQLLHRKSLRKSKPFLALNCSTLRGEMLAGELFGYKRGAFTGAVRDYRGLFASANGGTLFLDEIGELDLSLQASLLRVLETRRVKPLGQAMEEEADARILCATHRDLSDAVAKGLFREDLYFRIAQHTLSLPPLRERGSDVILLAYHFLEKAKAQNPGKTLTDFHPDALAQMLAYRWPGNVRELQNAVLKGAILSRSALVTLDFPSPATSWLSLEEATANFQNDYVAKALSLCSGDKEKAAQVLGVSRATVFRRLAKGGD